MSLRYRTLVLLHLWYLTLVQQIDRDLGRIGSCAGSFVTWAGHVQCERRLHLHLDPTQREIMFILERKTVRDNKWFEWHDKFFALCTRRLLHFIVVFCCRHRCDTRKGYREKNDKWHYRIPNGIGNQENTYTFTLNTWPRREVERDREKNHSSKNQSPRQTTTELSNGRLFNASKT